MELFVFGAVCGGVFVAASLFLLRVREEERDIATWAELLEQQERMAATYTPRAKTRLTNRQKTVEI